MSDIKIVTENELNYIETLYTYCNIEDFLQVHTIDYDFSDKFRPIALGLHKYPEWIGREIDSNMAYRSMLSYLHDTMLFNENYIGFSKGRSWYSLPNYRIGIMDFDTARKAKQFNCIIQYDYKHLFTLDKSLSLLELPFGGDFSNYHIKRIDITKIAKHEQNYLVNFGYISSFRGYSNHHGTIYLGDRKNGNVFRMYSKTDELLSTKNGKKIDSKKIEMLSKYFGDIENLYTYELELLRSHLKENLNIDTLADLGRIFDVYKNTVGKIRMYPDTDLNKKLLAQNNRKRIEAFILTDFVEYERVEKKKYTPSIEYAINKAIKVLDNYVSSMGIKPLIGKGLINPLFSEAYEDLISKMLERRVSNVFEQDTIELYEKFDLMSNTQTDDLEKEANYRFTSPFLARNESLISRI